MLRLMGVKKESNALRMPWAKVEQCPNMVKRSVTIVSGAEHRPMPSFGDDIGRLIPHLRRFARALVREHSPQVADDLVQETVVMAMRAERVARGSNLTSWCFAALMRVHRLREPSIMSAHDSGALGVAASGGRGATGSTLPLLPKDIARLDLLPLDEREVLLLAALVGMNYAQIADTLHVPLAAVMARLGQARNRLARADRSVGPNQSRRSAPVGKTRAAHHLRLVK